MPAGESSRSVIKYLLLLCVYASPAEDYVLVLHCDETSLKISVCSLPAAVVSTWKDIQDADVFTVSFN